MATLNLVEATIEDLQDALSLGALTSVELVALYLRRISRYDQCGVALNSIPILNNQVFEEAAASDDHRASGKPIRKLEGIPYTVKDSFKVKGMTAACGSPAFKNLVATDDAFTVSAIRAEGGVLIGRTNMPPMAYGGMQRGIYGRAESPYNPRYLAAAFASGSSNGSAVSTAASLAAFGMGEETVSSGRSPASNNAIVAYTPSRGWISIRGNWPLYPTCDVVVPHTRTMKDLLGLLEVIAVDDGSHKGDFWRDQPFVKLAKPWGGSPSPETFREIANSTSLQGLRFAVPAMYVGGSAPEGANPVTVSEEVIATWEEAKRQLEALGARVITVPDFPVVTGYENPELLPADSPRLPDNWHWTERGPLIAQGWDLFLRMNGDANLPNLASVDELNIYPDSMRTPAEMEHFPAQNAIHWGKLASYLENTTMYEVKDLKVAVIALEALRKYLLDDYLKRFNCDCFVFPAVGDVGAADADVDPSSAAHAWKNGVFYSHGNRAMRHLGVPSVTVPMGIIADKQMPVGLTFACRAYEDVSLLKWANAFEINNKMRTSPPHTPPLQSDNILLQQYATTRASRPLLVVQECVSISTADGGFLVIEIKGTLTVRPNATVQLFELDPVIQIMVDGQDLPQEKIHVSHVKGDGLGEGSVLFESRVTIPKPAKREERERTMESVARDKTMVVVLARSTPNSHAAGFLKLV